MADDSENEIEEPQKCEICVPGLPGWMATFSDLVTLLLTFFVLLLSFAKTESAKYEAALGSIRNAFGGNVLRHGEVVQRGKSPDNEPTMIESQEPVRPFPIDFLTMEGLLDKHEINRESDEDLITMKGDLKEFNLAESVNVFQMPEGIKVSIKDKVYFKKNSIKSSQIAVEVFQKMVKLLNGREWRVFVEGHSSRGETSKDGSKDAFELSSSRAIAVTRSLIKRGVRPDRITTVFYGDTRPNKIPGLKEADKAGKDRRVEFLIRKTDLKANGHKVDAH